MKKIFLTVLIVLLAFGAVFAEGRKEVDVSKFPERPVTCHVPWGIGGGADIVYRTVGEVFSKYSGGQTQLIKNVPGAAGAVGIADYNKTVRPNGYDVLSWNGAQTIKTHVSKVDYSVRDFKPVIKLISNFNYILVQSGSQFKTLKDLIDYAKANPGKLTMGHAGTGGGGHLASILFTEKAGIDLTFVPFGGGGPAAAGLLAGETMVSMNIPPEGLSNVEAGQLRALAVMGTHRLPQIPDIPTARELGYDVVYFQSRGIVVDKNTPDEIVMRLHDVYKQCLEDPVVQKKLYDMLTDVTYAGPEEYGKELVEEDAMFERIIKEYKIGDKY